jgi:hypothetical protein
MTAPILTFRDRLEQLGRRVRGPRHSFAAQCPNPSHGAGHGDRHPSLHVSEGKDGRVLAHCQAGCGLSDVLAPLGLEARDLFPRRASFRAARRTTRHSGHEIIIAGNCRDDVVHPPKSVDGTPEPQRLLPIDRAVLGIIKDHAFFWPRSCPSQELIGSQSGYSREEVNRSCQRLRRHGLISWVWRRHPGSKWFHNVYRIHTFWSRPHRAAVTARIARVRAALRCPPHTKRTAKDVKREEKGAQGGRTDERDRKRDAQRAPPMERRCGEGEKGWVAQVGLFEIDSAAVSPFSPSSDFAWGILADGATSHGYRPYLSDVWSALVADLGSVVLCPI